MDKLNLNPFGMSEQSFDPLAFAKMKADTVNNTDGDLTGYDCPKCRNRGFIADAKEDGGISIHECDCMRIRRCVWEMQKSGLENIIREKTFEAYNDTEPWQTLLKNGAMAYAENPVGWLLFCGQSGSGKTHLCTAVCRHLLLKGYEVRYMPWREKIGELKAMSLDNERRADILHGFKTAQVLYIDDLFKTGRAADGSTNPTVADINLAFDIINHREQNHLITIISTEKLPQELAEIDQATGGRMIDAAGKNVYQIPTNIRRNYRLRNVVTV